MWTIIGILIPTLVGIALALMAMPNASPTEFLVARCCFCLSALILFGSTLTWALKTGWPLLPRLVVGMLVGALIFVLFPVSMQWLKSRQLAKSPSEIAELLNWQRGDTKNPARVIFFTAEKEGVLTLQFAMENPSQFPAYDINVRVWDIANMTKTPRDIDDVLSRSITLVDIPSLAPGTAQLIGKTEIQPTESSKRLAAQFTTRVGAFSENINATKIDNKWLFAIRVRVSDVTGIVVFRKVDDGYPLNDNGDVDW